MLFYVIDLDRHDPEDWEDEHRERHALTAEAAAEREAEMLAENPDPERTYHIGVATKPDGSDLCEHIVVSRLTRVFEAKSVKSIAGMVKTRTKGSQ